MGEAVIITDLPISDYHNAIHPGKEVWLSKSTLREFSEMGPAYWKLANIDKTITKERPGGALQGLALDCYLTEGIDTFSKRFFVVPEDAPNKPTKKQRNAKKPAPETLLAIAYWDQFEGMEVLSADDYAIMLDAADAVRRCEHWPEIERARAQVTIRRQSPALGLGLQSRPDWLSNDRPVVFDLKKTANLDTFGKQAIDLGYHLQAAIAYWCLHDDGVEMERAFLIAAEWERGARCRCYEIPRDVIEYAYKKMERLASEIADRLARNDWTDKQESTEQLPVPEWYRRKMNEEMTEHA